MSDNWVRNLSWIRRVVRSKVILGEEVFRLEPLNIILLDKGVVDYRFSPPFRRSMSLAGSSSELHRIPRNIYTWFVCLSRIVLRLS